MAPSCRTQIWNTTPTPTTEPQLRPEVSSGPKVDTYPVQGTRITTQQPHNARSARRTTREGSCHSHRHARIPRTRTPVKDMLVTPYDTEKVKAKSYWSPLPTEAEHTLYRPYDRPMNPLMTIFRNIQGWLEWADHQNRAGRYDLEDPATLPVTPISPLAFFFAAREHYTQLGRDPPWAKLAQSATSGTPPMEGADIHMTDSAPPSSTGTVAAAPPTETLAGPTAPNVPKAAVAAKPPAVAGARTVTPPLLTGDVQMTDAPPQASANAVADSVKPDIRGDTSAWTVSSSSPSTSTSSSDSLRSSELRTTPDPEAVARDPQSPL